MSWSDTGSDICIIWHCSYFYETLCYNIIIIRCWDISVLPQDRRLDSGKSSEHIYFPQVDISSIAKLLEANKIIAYIGHFKVKCFYFLLVINLHTLLIKALGLQNRTLKDIIYHSLSLPYKWTWLRFPYIVRDIATYHHFCDSKLDMLCLRAYHNNYYFKSIESLVYVE